MSQIALALEHQGKSAVLGELLQHVIEEADAGGNGHGRRGIQVHRDLDVGFLGLALDPGATFGERAQDGGPGFAGVAVAAHSQAAHAEIAREFEVGIAIADHGAGGEVDLLLTHPGFDQLDLRLAAVAAVGLAMRAHEHRVELDALRAESVEHELVRDVECRLRKAGAAESILVGDHREPEARGLRLRAGRRTRPA